MIFKILAALIACNIYFPINDINTSQNAILSLTEWDIGYGSYKCYEDYRCITDTTSPQWRIQQKAWTDDNGLRRYEDRYCIALGSAFGTDIGDNYIIELETGAQFRCILADQKADCDTNAEHTADMNGAVIEFIVDTPMLNESVKQMGDVSYIAGMKGNVKRIYKE